MTGASGAARVWLRLEGLGTTALCVALYWVMGASWPLFALLFLAPDLTLLGYLGGPVIGARVHNVAHTSVFPLLLATAGLLTEAALPVHVAVIWLAHLGFDRALGYGLKYPTGFRDTHLGVIGRRRPKAG